MPISLQPESLALLKMYDSKVFADFFVSNFFVEVEKERKTNRKLLY